MDPDRHSSSRPELTLGALIWSNCLLSWTVISLLTVVVLSLKRIHIRNRVLAGLLVAQWGGFVQTLSSFEVLEF